MSKNRKTCRRSLCPLNASVEMLGDRWSLLILRDMMLRGAQTFNELAKTPEGIATNILADRLRKLVANGILRAESHPTDRRTSIYLLTTKGIDLAPVLLEMVLWAARYEETGNQALVREMLKDKDRFLRQIRRQWAASTGASDGNSENKLKPRRRK